MSHENVEAVVDYAQRYMGLATDESEWRETDREEEKGPYGEMYDHITYQHTSGIELHAVTHVDDGDSWNVMEGGPLLYDLCEDKDMGAAGYSQFGAVFCPKSFWERNGYLMMDVEHEHQAALLMCVHGMPSALADDEVEEGQFALPMNIKTMGDAHAYMQKLGYEYRDMTSASAVRATPPPGVAAPAGSKLDAHKAYGAEIINEVLTHFEGEGALREVEAGDTLPAELFLGQALIDALEKYDYTELLEGVVLNILDHVGIPDPLTNTFAWADRDEIKKRLEKAARGQAANMPAVKAAPAITATKEAQKLPPADLTGKPMDEVYRLAIRGKVPQIAAVAFAIDEERTHPELKEDEIGWWAGYVGYDGRLIRDLAIPDHVYAGWFPEYKKITWNDYDATGQDMSNYHTIPSPAEQHVEGFKAILRSRYIDRGAQEIADMVEPATVPLTPFGTAEVNRTVPTYAAYSASSESNIVTLKAFPPGHTGKAPPVAAAPAADDTSGIGAPTSVSTAPDTSSLWREYQLDITALQERGIQRAGYQVVDTSPAVVFALGFLDEAGGIVDVIPQTEVLNLFSEYTIRCLDDGITYEVKKLFGQQLSELESVVRERLKDVKIFDIAE